MSLLNILTTTICSTFSTVCGKWQSKKAEPKAFVMEFGLTLDYDKEEGHRNLVVALYACNNYVNVYTRETWDVIPLEDLEYSEEDDESYVKPGKDYQKGKSPWTLVVSHDSGWTSGVRNILQDKRINTLRADDTFYKLVDPLDLP
jgi:hypothetical protein